jgi:hypothetical protein
MLTACSGKQSLFTGLSSSQSGIDFRNEIGNNTGDQSLISEFSYMGGGVGVGDFNKDGLKDIVFSGNQVSCALYINKGNNRFENITEPAALKTNSWATGVSIVDINQDGYDDIYICVFGKDLLHRAKNLLFINQRNLTFREQADEYGLADMSHSTQAAFLDYDKDGDLDMYLLNYRLNGSNGNFITPIDRSGRSPANDRLYRNDGDIHGKGHPRFTDVTIEAGIKEDGFGLGVSVSDFNGDNWPDIYVSNDFVSNDELWLNNRNGTFTNRAGAAMKHQGYSGMGSDAADINNDGRPDAATLDMMPEYNNRKKLSFSFMNYERYQMERSMGYEPEFMRNMLQLNNGNRFQGDTAVPFFSEIGQLAGISETDWSWSILAADFNNDGWKDLHITNGIGRDYINADFLQFSENLQVKGYTENEKRKVLNERLVSIEPVELGNYFYLNQKNYSFGNQSREAGIDEKSLSSGAAYVDLDNDGDLDVVVNNINRQAFVFLNNTNQPGKPASTHFIRINLAGVPSNAAGFGARVFVYAKDGVQLQEQMPVRGYLSSVDQTLIFGLGNQAAADSIVVIWPNDRKQTLRNVQAGGTLTLHQTDAGSAFDLLPRENNQLLAEVTSEKNVMYKHLDVPFNDFAQQRLLPQKFSQQGPYVTAADINNDGLEDFYAGGGFNSAGRLFMQQPSGTFISLTAITKDVMQEETDCLFFDADKDGDNDLLVTYGDMRFEDSSRYYRPTLFLNDGKGHFTADEGAIPSLVRTIAGCVRATDFDNDGYIDLFIGGRVSHQYPKAPASFLLKNTGGVFADVTKAVCPRTGIWRNDQLGYLGGY